MIGIMIGIPFGQLNPYLIIPYLSHRGSFGNSFPVAPRTASCEPRFSHNAEAASRCRWRRICRTSIFFSNEQLDHGSSRGRRVKPLSSWWFEPLWKILLLIVPYWGVTRRQSDLATQRSRSSQFWPPVTHRCLFVRSPAFRAGWKCGCQQGQPNPAGVANDSKLPTSTRLQKLLVPSWSPG